ncbi:hypothetical protein [Phenylobacterium immobile]|uniref:hypothetical protein n=1 Tax=Phenylobacterium immobile TaxID=21 RepID=UPI000A431163|nr:hypothetical protein [Phenylobacterium immobile]
MSIKSAHRLLASVSTATAGWRSLAVAEQSVWCFFAAAGSIVLLGHFAWARRRHLVVAAA